MRMIAYIVILAALFFVPLERMDVAMLEPVQIIYICQDGERVRISTDTDAVGEGVDIADALRSLHQTTPGVVYLGTAEYLLFDRASETAIADARQLLPQNLTICLAESVDYENLAKFLDTHGKLPRFRDWEPGDPLPELQGEKIV